MYQVNTLKKIGKGKKKSHGKGLTIEPTLDDLPLEPTATDEHCASAVAGVYKNAPVEETTRPVPTALGRLAFELRTLLENSSTDMSQHHLTSGRLSRNWAAIARGADDVFHRRRIEDGIESAVLICVDRSDSMAGRNMIAAADATRMIGAALGRCSGTAWAVHGFTDTWMSSQHGVGGAYASFEKAAWTVYKGWNETAGTLTRRAGTLYNTEGGTPEVAAMQDALVNISARPEPRKIIIFIGDGNGYKAKAMKALQQKHQGVTVIGIGINVDLSKCFDHAVRVNKASDLATASFKAVIKALAA
jgi:cobalamin biosynthesis protein CobT